MIRSNAHFRKGRRQGGSPADEFSGTPANGISGRHANYVPACCRIAMEENANLRLLVCRLEGQVVTLEDKIVTLEADLVKSEVKLVKSEAKSLAKGHYSGTPSRLIGANRGEIVRESSHGMAMLQKCHRIWNRHT